MDALVEGLQACIADYEIKMKNDSNEAERIRHAEMIEAMEAELVKQERKRKKLFDDYEDEVYTRDEFIERKQVYAQLIDDLKEKIQIAKENLPEVVDYSEKIVTLHQMIEVINNEEVDAQAKNDFLRKYIEDIKYDVIDYGRMKGGKPVLDVFLK